MNRPHVAALLRSIAEEFEEQARLATFIDDPVTRREVDRLISDLVERLRVRAGEIEAGG